jgi:hypothetical protein
LGEALKCERERLGEALKCERERLGDALKCENERLEDESAEKYKTHSSPGQVQRFVSLLVEAGAG